MIKNYFSTISFLLLFIGLHGFSKNLRDGSRWSTPVSFELVSVPLSDLPDNSFYYGSSIDHADFFEDVSEISSLADAKMYFSPECPTEGQSCDDGNSNTINDALDADCNCVGVAIALACEETEISYQINNSGPRQIGGTEITVGEGDTVELFANLANYTITGPNGVVVTANTMNDILPSQAGTYTVNTAFRRQTAIPNVVSVSSQHTTTGNNSISAAFDNDPTTFWHSNYNDPVSRYPHELVFDMGAGAVLSGFTYLPRTGSGDGDTNGRIGTYDIYVSNTLGSWGTAVVQNGTFASNDALKTVRFTPRQGRYLRFVAKTPAIANQVWATAAELSVLRGATATASSALSISPSSNATDNNDNTIWQTASGATGSPYITLDLGIESNVTGIEYLPRQSGTTGRITSYEVFISNSLSNFGTRVGTGTWSYTNNATGLKTASFPEKKGRYVRLVSTTGAAASAAEFRAISSTINFPCAKTIQINVDKIETYTYTDGTWSPTTPVGVVTANDNITIASGDAVIATNITFNNLIVEPGASLTVDSGAIVNATTTTLKSRSNSYSSLIVNGEINGVVNYGRWVNKMGTAAGGGNDLISSPLTNAKFNNAFRIANPNLPQNPSQPGVFAFAPYNVISGAYENYNIGADYLGEFSLISGTGYRAATIALTPQTGNTLTFTGEATKSDVNIAISDGGLGEAWNLIGNPYPSYLDFKTFFDININEFRPDGAYQAIYGYKGNSSDWNILNYATAETDQLIAPGQGFFVKAKAGGGSVQFTTAMRRKGGSDDFIVGRPGSSSRALSKLKLSSASKEVTTSVYFIDGTSRGLDVGYDAAAYAATKVDFAIFSKLLEDNSGLDIAIQSLPYTDYNDVIVPLGIKAKAGTELSISIDELSTLPSNIKVYLEDTQNNTLTLLNDEAFTFKPTTNLNGADRFNVHYSAKTLSIDDMSANDNLRIYTTTSPKTLFITGQLSGPTTAQLYDIHGRLVLGQVLNMNTTENTMDISTMSTGVYVVKLNNEHQFKTQKLIIK
ncbi:discoidin domain-containing protein [Gelidibacter pelagius]|uniref:Discoidin domain-containing protein n=1 Tax=Gelidibacter pelagius TaxID=2819985 RepID=A0ABS3SPC6_9FLAO|nr:discoidin domain-containing protein [Gelidibacter pelagius]MBO3097276.1 discoidin domain-containing protein [Gelidibacter pelagius]